MSFLTRTTPVLRAATRQSHARLFTTAVVYRKSATDTVKDALNTVNKAVGDTLVAGIDKGEQVKDAAASAAGVNTDKAEGAAAQMAGEAKGKAAEVKGQAKGKVEEVKGKMS